MAHLLVTNDFPPKVGGIQSLLWEWWRRLPPDRVTVLTTPYPGAEAFDRAAPMRIVRSRHRVLLPTRSVQREIEALAAEVGADVVVLDPALPLGWLGPSLAKKGLPYAVVLHGAEITVPGRLPGSRHLLGTVLRHASRVIAAGPYPLAEAERVAGRALPATVIACGVDTRRISPVADDAARDALRRHLSLPMTAEGPVIASSSRLVPRKGMDRLIDAAGLLHSKYPGLVVAISGAGRDRARLERRLAHISRTVSVDVRFLGRLSDDDLAALYRTADLYVMLCRNRWFGLEQEGFGIVFIEAAAAGVAQVAGASGGAADAVIDGVTGRIVQHPRDAHAAAAVIDELLSDRPLLREMGLAARRRVEADLDHERLAAQLDTVLMDLERDARQAQRSRPR